MKTNVIMIRNDERFLQRTKDGYFNANELLKNWNEKSNEKKQLGNFKKNTSTRDFIEQLKKEGIENPIISSRGINGATWLHPKLFIDFAMWVSVEFKSKVIDYVLDGLINSRHDAGDFYNEMCATILDKYIEHKGTKPPATIYINEANTIKKILSLNGKNRNEMTEKDLNNITQLQKMNSLLISKNVGKDSRVKRLKELAEIL
jgi:hypothetical protein